MKKISLPIALTMGDPSGIGPEIVVRSVYNLEIKNYLVFGDPLVFQEIIDLIGLPIKINVIKTLSEAKFKKYTLNLIATSNFKTNPKFGVVSKECGVASYDAIVASIRLAKEKKIAAIVTAPINKEALNKANIKFPGHTEILSSFSEASSVSMMLINDSIKTVLVTLHCSMSEALKMITIENELKAIKHAYLGAKMCGVSKPVVAVAALNPHAGEMGLFGDEEKKIIEPAIQLAKEKGIDARGPFPGDTIYMNAKKGKYDIVVSQYHDQGLIPIKYEGIEDGVNITVGLDYIRTSPDHGTAFDIAGKNKASPKSFMKAIETALSLTL